MDARIEPVATLTKGYASPEEIAALAVVLVVRDTAPKPPRRRTARWRAPAYGVAHSWRTAP